MKIARAAGILVFLFFISAEPGRAPIEIEELKQQALSEDFNVSRMALKSLNAKGAAARPALREVAKELLSRDKAKVSENAALLADGVKYRELDQKLATQRKAALDNIA